MTTVTDSWANRSEDPSSHVGERSAPLRDLKVLDLSQAVSGPFAGRILADLGADVVKVEWSNGDVANYFGEVRGGVSGLFSHMNAGKRGIAVDLVHPLGKTIVRRLASHADVVIENFRPGVLDRAGVGYNELSALNQRLVMLSISGFGQRGPESGRMAFAPVIHAESGLLSRQAEFDQSAHIPDIAFNVGDVLAGVHGAVAILAALHARRRSGRGQHIDMSMLEAMVASDDYVHYALDESRQALPQRGEVWDAPGGPLMIAADRKLLWVRLRDYLGQDNAAIERNCSVDEGIASRKSRIANWIKSFDSRDGLIAALEAAGLAWADVRTPSDVLSSPTLMALGSVVDVPDASGVSRRVIRMPYHLSASECGVRGSAPVGGEHANEVLKEWLWLGPNEVARLEADGALRAPEAGSPA